MKSVRFYYAIAVRGATFQAQRVDFDARGTSVVTALTEWLPGMLEAEAAIRPLGWLPYRQREPRQQVERT